MIKNQELIKQGFVILDFPIEKKVLDCLDTKNWPMLDQYFLEISKPGRLLFQFLSKVLDFQILEHIISIRQAPGDEDGIWHDDGSRVLGFSLSLNLTPSNISGGELFFKPKSSEVPLIFHPLPLGKMIIFLSGLSGFEHKVGAVGHGTRIVIAGWCS